MRKIFLILLILVLPAHMAAAPVHAQDTVVRTDTVRGPIFDDDMIARAFGLPKPTQAHIDVFAREARCGGPPTALLCNLTVQGKSWKDCANIALVGQIHLFSAEGARPESRQVHVAVLCGDQTIQTGTQAQFPMIEFTLASRQNDRIEREVRTVVYIVSDND
jgi:hypothetical protein